MERASDIHLFMKSYDGLDDEAVEYLKVQRAVAMDRAKKLLKLLQ